MKQKRPNISIDRLREIIMEEYSVSVNEQIDHAGAKTVVTAASKLLKGIEAYKKSATGTMQSAIGNALAGIETQLEDMISTPGSYVDKPKPEPKKVTLRAVKDGD